MPNNVIQFPETRTQRNRDGLSEYEVKEALAFAYRTGAAAEVNVTDQGAAHVDLDGHPRVNGMFREDGRYFALSDIGEPVAEADSMEALVARL